MDAAWSNEVPSKYTIATARKMTEGGDSPVSVAQMELVSTELRTRWFSGAGPQYVPLRYGVDGTGSCFFFSVAAAMNSENFHSRNKKEQLSIGRNFRKALAKTVEGGEWDRAWQQRTEDFNRGSVPKCKQVLKMFEDKAVWADAPMILYTMNAINLNVIFFDMLTNNVYCGVHGSDSSNPDGQTVLVMWVQRTHFEPIFVLDNTTAQVETCFRNDHPVVRNIMKQYNDQCGMDWLAI